MYRTVVQVVISVILLTSLLVACSSAAQPPTPTQSTSQTSSATEPTKPAVSSLISTATPATKLDFPAKGKTITMIVPWAAGGVADTGSRILAAALEKELGIPIEVVTKPGAGTQTGLTELARSKPDGYTVGQISSPTFQTLYMDPERQAIFKANSFVPIAGHVDDPGALGVAAESPYKTLNDFLDAARAEPEKIKVANTGTGTLTHFEALQVQRTAGVKFSHVTFDGGATAVTALLGRHVDAYTGTLPDFIPHIKSERIRVLGVMSQARSSFAPDVKTFKEQGLDVILGTTRVWAAPAGTPEAIVSFLNSAFKKALEDPEVQKKTAETGQSLRYLSPSEITKLWADLETLVTELRPLVQETSR